MKRFFLATALLIFVSITTFGLNASMKMHEDGSMSNCPLMIGQSSICKMPVSEHISWWQQLFTAIPQLSSFLFLTFVLFTGLTFLIFQFTLAPPNALNFKVYRRSNPHIKLFNYLSLAFSKGLLHPKIYS